MTDLIANGENGASVRAKLNSLGAGRRLRHVGTRGGLFGVTVSNGTNLQLNSQTKHNIPVACRGLRFGWSNFWINSGSNPYEMSGAIDVSKLAVGVSNLTQTPALITRAFFGGMPDTTLPINSLKITDPQGAHVAAGDIVQLNVHVEVGGSTPFYRGRGATSATGERSEEGVTVTDKSMTGGVATVGAFTYVPQVILGYPDDPTKRSVLLCGNSIVEGGSGGETAGANGVIGYAEKGIGVSVPNAKFSRSGDRIRAWINRRYSKMAMGLEYFTDAWVDNVTNDMYVDHRSLAQIQSDMTTFVTELQACGILVTMPTAIPITTGAWSLADGSDQTVTADEATRVAWNAWLLGGGLPGVRVIDIAALVSIPGNPAKWIAGYTNDGVHPNNTGAAAAAAGHPPSLYGY